MSNNKAFQRYLREQASAMAKINPEFTLNGNTEFIKLCRDNWKLKTEEERKCYYSCVEIPLKKKVTQANHNLRTSDVEYEFVDKYYRKLSQILVNVSDEELLTRKFHIISTNVLCKIDDNSYPLLEIGLVEYTIRDGIGRSYHKFVNAGDIPFGFAFEALNHAQTTHKIPLKNFILASNDYSVIVDEIKQIIPDFSGPANDCLHPVVLFSKSDQMEQNCGALKWLEDRYREQSMESAYNGPHVYGNKWNIEILSIADLLFYVMTKMGASKPYALCVDEMDSCAFDYSFDTDCHYHDTIDCIHCAIGHSKRLCYILSVNFQPIFKFEFTANHAPQVDRSRLGSVSYVNLKNYKSSTNIRRNETESSEPAQQKSNETAAFCGIGRGHKFKDNY